MLLNCLTSLSLHTCWMRRKCLFLQTYIPWTCRHVSFFCWHSSLHTCWMLRNSSCSLILQTCLMSRKCYVLGLADMFDGFFSCMLWGWMLRNCFGACTHVGSAELVMFFYMLDVFFALCALDLHTCWMLRNCLYSWICTQCLMLRKCLTCWKRGQKTRVFGHRFLSRVQSWHFGLVLFYFWWSCCFGGIFIQRLLRHFHHL